MPTAEINFFKNIFKLLRNKSYKSGKLIKFNYFVMKTVKHDYVVSTYSRIWVLTDLK